jgi:uncharacterized membrane protein
MSTRVRAFDWLRGGAVLVMIETHALVLLRPELRAGDFFTTLQWIDGLVAPAFILASGFSLALTQVRAAAGAQSALARRQRLRKTLRRIGEVLAVATLVNWMWFPIFREPRWILRVDILQCIGLSLLIALPFFFLLAPRPRVLRAAALCGAALAFGLAPLAEHVGPPLAMLVNHTTGAVFPLLPWSGYVYLGAAIGVTSAIGGARDTALWLLGLTAVGVLLWVLTPQVSALYPPHEFWVTDPTNHARRWTQVCLIALALLGLENLHRAPAESRRPPAPVRFIEVFGSSSLAAYFFHQMLLYFHLFGFSFEKFWGNRCSWTSYCALLALLIAMTFALTVATDAVYKLFYSRLEHFNRPTRAH